MNIPTPLLRATKKYAVEHNTSVTQLVVAGLTQVLATEAVQQQSLSDFIKSLPPKKVLSDAARTQTYHKHLEQKYGSSVS